MKNQNCSFCTFPTNNIPGAIIKFVMHSSYRNKANRVRARAEFWKPRHASERKIRPRPEEVTFLPSI